MSAKHVLQNLSAWLKLLSIDTHVDEELRISET